MKRYIDADKLYADIAKDVYMLRDRINSRDYGMFLIGIKEKIDEAPTVDVVEVVRCAECDYRGDPIACPIEINDLHHISDYDYCSYGLRRD